MSFKPLYCSDRWKGLLAILGLFLLDAIFVRIVITRPVDGASYVLGVLALGSLPVAGYLAYRTAGAFTLEYRVDRDAVTVIWGPTRQVVPMGQIECIQIDAAPRADDRPRPWHWPCPDCRWSESAQLGPVRMYGTRPLAGQVVLVTAEGGYGLSPADPEAFIRALQDCYQLGVARPLRAAVQRSPLWTWPLWRDRRALAVIGLGLLGVLFMFGMLCFRFPVLSADLPLHFDVNGLPDRIAPKTGLFLLPIIGGLTWAANLAGGVWIYRQLQRQAAYLLWAGAVIVQVIMGVALMNLMRW